MERMERSIQQMERLMQKMREDHEESTEQMERSMEQMRVDHEESMEELRKENRMVLNIGPEMDQEIEN